MKPLKRYLSSSCLRAVATTVVLAIGLSAFTPILSSKDAVASVPALAKRSSTIFRKPSKKSTAIVKLKKATKVSVLGKRGSWFKVQIRVRKGKKIFKIEGWTLRGNLVKQEKRVIKKPKKKKAKKKRRRVRAEEFEDYDDESGDDLLEKLIDKRSSKKSKKKRSKAKKKRRFHEPGEKHEWIEDRLDIGLDFGYRILSYKISDSASQISYDIPGFVIGPKVHYEYLTFLEDRLGLALDLSYQLEFKNYSINLQDDSSPAAEISNSAEVGTGQLLDIYLSGIYRFSGKKVPGTVKLMLGYLSTSSDLKDAQLRNLDINLFTDTTFSHTYGGVGFSVPLQLSGVQGGLTFDAKYFLSSSFTEKADDGTENISGQSPTASSGYQIHLGAFWRLSEHLTADFKLGRQEQGADFTGAGQRLNNTSQAITFTDAQITDTQHSVMLGVNYAF